ncbi:hypothetical protein EGW08_023656 [Elysia chlorotica]|uniref:MARVEL domain-containing protein n=1 Tax=Elysia chlorotica TaxID=188477 RepID=A0A3S1AUF6_ELYCH|nr:hypothetical protein EGW08_023656 [Elysia chlorotica]
MALRSIILVLIFAFLVASFVLHIIALATPEWSTLGALGGFVRQGLFQRCIGDNCERIENVSNHIRASGAFGMMGALTLLATGVTCFLCLVKEVDGHTSAKIVRLVSLIMSCAAETLIIICITMYVTSDTQGLTLEIGFSMKSAITGAVCLGISTVLQAIWLLRC